MGKWNRWLKALCATVVLVGAMSATTGCTVLSGPAADASHGSTEWGATAAAMPLSGPAIQGRILVAKEGGIWVLQDGELKRIASGLRYSCPAWSPDGQQIAVVAGGDNHSDLFILNGDGSQEWQLTNNWSNNRVQDCAWVRSPTWSPDGDLIAFASDMRGSSMQLWVADLAEGTPRQFGGGALVSNIDYLSWSPDGGTLALTGFLGGSSQIYLVDVESGSWKKATDAADGALQPAWSPDGSQIAFVVRSGQESDVWIMNADGSGQTRVTTEGTAAAPAWSPDGSLIAYLAGKPSSDLYVITLGTGESKGEAVTSGAYIDTPSRLSWVD